MNKVLIIEYDEDILDLVDYILIGCGLKVYSGNENICMGAINELQPKLIILDHTFHHGQENTLCHKLKSN